MTRLTHGGAGLRAREYADARPDCLRTSALKPNRHNYSGPRAAAGSAPAGAGESQPYQTYMAFGGDMQQSMTKIEVHEAAPGVLVLTCHGGLSWEDRDQLSECVHGHFRGTEPPAGVVMDLEDVEYVNSAGLGALFQLCRLLRNRGGTLAFANASDALVRLFRTIGLDRLAQVSDTVEEAVDQLRGESEELELLPEPEGGASGRTRGANYQPERDRFESGDEVVPPMSESSPTSESPSTSPRRRRRRQQ